MPDLAPSTRTPQFDVHVDGKTIEKAAMDALLECVVESSLHLPDLCALRIYDYGFKWLDADLFKEGGRLEIKAGWDRGSLTSVFDGEIVGVEMDLSAHHTATMIVRAYDKSHRLHRGRKCRPFVDVKDSDAVQTVAAAVGLSVDARPTMVVRPWLLQNNQTDWEFLMERARRNGYDLFMKSGTLHFLPAGGRKEFGRVHLTWGEDLRSFRPRTSAAGQVETVEVRGWDPKTKQKIVATAKSPQGTPQIGGEQDGAKAAKTFGSQKTVVVDQPVHSVEEAEVLAQSIRDQIGQEFLTADGLCDGTPQLMAGTVVEIANIGKRFSGDYYVTAATHVYSPAEGYSTQFSVTGTQADNVLSLMGDNKDPGGTTSDVGGNIVTAIVVDNLDPEGLGRVKVQYPWMADSLASFWARIVSQMAGAGRGFFNLPEVGDEVLVAFEHGETSRPYVLGQLWNGVDKPPALTGKKEVEGGKVNRRGYYTRIGHKIDLDDTGGKGYIALYTAGKHEIVLSDVDEGIWAKTTGGHVLEMSDKHHAIKVTSTGGHKVVMDDEGKKITITDSGGNTMTMDATGGKVSIQANLEINLIAPTINLTADEKIGATAGAQMQITAGADMTLEAGAQLGATAGAEMSLEAGAAFSLEAGGEASILAPMVLINS